jgi:hypothetical protein
VVLEVVDAEEKSCARRVNQSIQRGFNPLTEVSELQIP